MTVIDGIMYTVQNGGLWGIPSLMCNRADQNIRSLFAVGVIIGALSSLLMPQIFC